MAMNRAEIRICARYDIYFEIESGKRRLWCGRSSRHGSGPGSGADRICLQVRPCGICSNAVRRFIERRGMRCVQHPTKETWEAVGAILRAGATTSCSCH